MFQPVGDLLVLDVLFNDDVSQRVSALVDIIFHQPLNKGVFTVQGTGLFKKVARFFQLAASKVQVCEVAHEGDIVFVKIQRCSQIAFGKLVIARFQCAKSQFIVDVAAVAFELQGLNEGVLRLLEAFKTPERPTLQEIGVPDLRVCSIY